MTETQIHGVTWVLFDDALEYVRVERCEKKRRVLGVGEWFIPGGKIEPLDKDPDHALLREIAEEWPGVNVDEFEPLPLVEGSPVESNVRGIFLMRPYRIVVHKTQTLPSVSAEGTPLQWALVDGPLGLHSPVPQVRMMIAAALCAAERQRFLKTVRHVGPSRR